MVGRNIICAIACAAIAAPAVAQSQGEVAAISQPTALAPPAADAMIVAARTIVDIEITQALDSKTTKPGERFTIRLADPIVVGGRTIIPAGITGEGEVIHAAKARMGGKAGELVLAVRHLDCGATRIGLGYFKFGQAGENRAVAALATSMILPMAGLLIAGGEMRVAPGTRANAPVRSDITVPGGAVPDCAPAGVSQPQPEGEDDEE